MEVAVIDYDSDTTVEIGNTCYCSYKLGCVCLFIILSINPYLVETTGYRI
jgi:hypothetical protein